jgi:selenocysteine lyase/cysteine desulfurase
MSTGEAWDLPEVHANPLRQHERIKFLTDFDPTRSCAITSFQVEGMDPVELKRTLRNKYQLRRETLPRARTAVAYRYYRWRLLDEQR